jgi:bifunctional non-homologous end joining protein LigD
MPIRAVIASPLSPEKPSTPVPDCCDNSSAGNLPDPAKIRNVNVTSPIDLHRAVCGVDPCGNGRSTIAVSGSITADGANNSVRTDFANPGIAGDIEVSGAIDCNSFAFVCACVAGPPSPLKPIMPVPATVDLRSSAWWKMRVQTGQEFVIAGYTLGKPFDAVLFGYYQGEQLVYAARTRAGFTPASRVALFRKFQDLELPDCPFANLPEPQNGRSGRGLTEGRMKACRWLKPVLVGEFEFLEWTGAKHLRHFRFLALRDDKNAKDLMRESHIRAAKNGRLEAAQPVTRPLQVE